MVISVPLLHRGQDAGVRGQHITSSHRKNTKRFRCVGLSIKSMWRLTVLSLEFLGSSMVQGRRQKPNVRAKPDGLAAQDRRETR